MNLFSTDLQVLVQPKVTGMSWPGLQMLGQCWQGLIELLHRMKVSIELIEGRCAPDANKKYR